MFVQKNSSQIILSLIIIDAMTLQYNSCNNSLEFYFVSLLNSIEMDCAEYRTQE